MSAAEDAFRTRKPPNRFWGPVTVARAKSLTEDILESTELEVILNRFACGAIDGQEMRYEIEVLFEELELLPLREAKADHGDAVGDLENG